MDRITVKHWSNSIGSRALCVCVRAPCQLPAPLDTFALWTFKNHFICGTGPDGKWCAFRDRVANLFGKNHKNRKEIRIEVTLAFMRWLRVFSSFGGASEEHLNLTDAGQIMDAPINENFNEGISGWFDCYHTGAGGPLCHCLFRFLSRRWCRAVQTTSSPFVIVPRYLCQFSPSYPSASESSALTLVRITFSFYFLLCIMRGDNVSFAFVYYLYFIHNKIQRAAPISRCRLSAHSLRLMPCNGKSFSSRTEKQTRERARKMASETRATLSWKRSYKDCH